MVISKLSPRFPVMLSFSRLESWWLKMDVQKSSPFPVCWNRLVYRWAIMSLKSRICLSLYMYFLFSFSVITEVLWWHFYFPYVESKIWHVIASPQNTVKWHVIRSYWLQISVTHLPPLEFPYSFFVKTPCLVKYPSLVFACCQQVLETNGSWYF